MGWTAMTRGLWIVMLVAATAVAQPGAGSNCDPNANCTTDPTTVGTVPPLTLPVQPTQQPAQPQPPPPEAVSPGWAHGAAILGFASAGVIGALTVGVVLENSTDTADTAREIGAIAILYTAVALPVTAIGGHSARHHHLVRGLPALRIVGWVGYGLTLADSLTLLALSFDNQISNLQIVSVGFLGAISSLAFALDANASAGQAAVVNHIAVQPTVGLLRTPEHESVPALVLSGRF